MSQALADKLQIARDEANKEKEQAVCNQDFPTACKYRDIGERIARLKIDALNPEKKATGVCLSAKEAVEQIQKKKKGNRMNFRDMPQELLVDLLTKVRHSLIGCEDAQDSVLAVSELLSVNQEAGAENQYEV
jgi:hypothetical protein